MAEAFRSRDLPVVLVTVIGMALGRTEQSRQLAALPADWADLVAELNRQPQDHTVAKRTAGAFPGTDPETHLKTLGVTQVVIAGVATSFGVESTARHAHELGFHVTLAVDAMTDTNAEAHANSVTRIFPRIGETGRRRTSWTCSTGQGFDAVPATVGTGRALDDDRRPVRLGSRCRRQTPGRRARLHL